MNTAEELAIATGYKDIQHFESSTGMSIGTWNSRFDLSYRCPIKASYAQPIYVGAKVTAKDELVKELGKQIKKLNSKNRVMDQIVDTVKKTTLEFIHINFGIEKELIDISDVKFTKYKGFYLTEGMHVNYEVQSQGKIASYPHIFTIIEPSRMYIKILLKYITSITKNVDL